LTSSSRTDCSVPQAIFLLFVDGGVVKGKAALLGDAVADLLHVEIGDAINDRQHECSAERQGSGQYHRPTPSMSCNLIARPPLRKRQARYRLLREPKLTAGAPQQKLPHRKKEIE
jgi:hypothetical protein